jgi:hypothetical protein
MFTLEFRTDNAAFDDGMAHETARILRDVAIRLMQGDLEGHARDVNGNRVGVFALTSSNPRES